MKQMNIIFRYYVCILKNKQFMKLRIGIAGLFLLFMVAINAQQSRLADIYFNDGEFEKAAEVYKSLYEKNKGITVYFQKYTECLISLRRFEEAEKALNSEIKSRPNDASLYVALGNMQTIMNDEVRGKKSFEEAVKRAGSDPNQTDMVARSFLSMGFNEYAAKSPHLSPQFLFVTDGYNFRNHEIPALIGRSQLTRLEKSIDIRRNNYELFRDYINNNDKFYSISENPGNSSFCFPIISKSKETKVRLEEMLNEYRIEYRPIVGGNLLKHPFLYRYSLISVNDIPNADILNDLGLYIGNSQFVSSNDIKKLGGIINDC
jgi:tetratricopeptide (TPR) repeat protein